MVEAHTRLPTGISREDFDKLPPIISRKVFLLATGLDHKAFRQMALDGDIARLPVGKSKTKGNYYKADAARIAGYVRVECKHGI